MELLNLNEAEERLGEDICLYKIEYLASPDAPSEYKKGLITMSTGGQVKYVEFVLLAMNYNRILWPEHDPNDPDPQPLCKSLNGYEASGGTDTMPGPCQKRAKGKTRKLIPVCPHAKWSDGCPPACAEVYNLFCWDLNEDQPFVFAIKRTGIKKLRALKSFLKRSKETWRIGDFHTNCCVKLRLTPRSVSTYYVPSFEGDDGRIFAEKLPEKQAARFDQIALTLMDAFKQIDAETSTGPANGSNGSPKRS